MNRRIHSFQAATVFAVAALFSCAGCGRADEVSGVPAKPRGWTEHKDPQGFSVQVPREWSVTPDARSGRVTIAGPGEEQVLIWPVFIPGAMPSQAAGAVLTHLAGRVMPATRWDVPQPMGSSAVRATGQAAGQSAVAAFVWVVSPRGTAGCLYTSAAPSERFRESEDTFAQILASFRATGAPVQETEDRKPGVKYVRWADPREQAFSLEIPQGWNIEGGLYRAASVDTRIGFVLTSPDGDIRLTGGDWELPTFTEPNQMLMMTGFREGSWYSPGYGVNFLVRRYVPGTAFAQEYVASKITRGGSDLRFTESRDRPDAVETFNQINAQYGQLGMSIFFTAGEVFFTFRQNGRDLEGYYFAATRRIQPPGMPSGLWNAEYLFGCIAPPTKKALAEEVLAHMVKTFELNPQWLAMQQGIAANTSKIVSRTHEEISGIIQSTYENRQRSQDEISRRRSNVTLGVEDVIDPVTGRELKIESGSNYYWIDHRGTIVGTDTHTLPGLDFREMIRLP
ncbi:MAG: hypothetical protein KJ726_04790 [Verrucomicrobia bacterium]|nr:hypothetical protein [Verrucomicrobiota bacterium]MBU1909346.1 hypothetical protein [Verrucomicrobiota bacterium]